MADKSEDRKTLEARAKVLGLTVPGNIKDDTLARKIAEAAKKVTAQEISPRDGTSLVSPQQAGGGSSPANNTQASEANARAPAESGHAAQAGGPTPLANPASAKMVIEVTGPKQGRRRAGRKFTSEPTTIALEDLSEDEKQALIGDPLLSVTTRPADA